MWCCSEVATGGAGVVMWGGGREAAQLRAGAGRWPAMARRGARG